MTCTEQSLFEFFDTLVRQALKGPVSVSETARVYLVRILADPTYGTRDVQVPLAQRWLIANSRKTTDGDRIRLLRSIGDDALLLCGFWWQHVYRVYRRSLDPRYHIGMGRMAYQQIDGEPFSELAEKFPSLIDALIRVADACASRTPEDLVRLMDLWRTTHSRYAREALAREGIPAHLLLTAPS